MKAALRHAMTFLLLGVAGCMFFFLAVLAATDEITPPSDIHTLNLGMPIGGEGNDDRFDVDRLRELCNVPWPASLVGDQAKADEAWQKACRSFGK